MSILDKYIAKAQEEIGHTAAPHGKTLKAIQRETALVWCGRAIVAITEVGSEHDATEYAHESIEHAALSGDEELLRIVRHAIRSYGIKV